MKNLKLRMFVPGYGMRYSGIYDKNWYDHPEKCVNPRSKHQSDHIFDLMIGLDIFDKNGKEIYSGDIIKSSNNGKNDADEWSDEICVVNFSILSGIEFYDGEISWDFENEESIYSLKFCEIIGNAFENENLLDPCMKKLFRKLANPK